MNNLNLNIVIKKIKTSGYWKLVIEPTKPVPNFFNHISEAEDLIENSSIKLRGWNYPHVPNENQQHQGIEIQNHRVNGFIIWHHFLEAWSFYDSGQFVHIFGLREDWFKESDWLTEQDHLKHIEPNTILDFVGTTLSVTEMLLFSQNLINNAKYGDSVRITISLHNVQNRKLTTIDPNRVPMFSNYMATTNEITGFEKVVTKTDLNDNTLLLAEETVIRIFKFFRGFNPPIQVIKDDQKKLIERRL